ncbi:MAG TPA: Na+/H+ antiporter NhaA [Vicinamibacterales bacterium]|nr:Na+/H+ antiporter NhaA [Vicinamibacterales bacterium]
MAAKNNSSLATRVIELALNNSLLLVFGAVAALVWANFEPESYRWASRLLYFGIDDIGMVFFFALAAKEVYEATLPGGPLSSSREAAVPLLAAAGGMVVPAGMYALTVVAIGRHDLVRGWAVPCATDIAFAYLVVRLIFPRGHPAIPFLLLLAIADDALGLVLLAAFYPSGPVSIGIFAACLGPAMALAWLLRRGGIKSFWAYLLGPGVLSWIGFFYGGFHPALAMVPIVPFMPHYRSDLTEFGEHAVSGVTTLQAFEHWWRVPVQIVLLFFGLANAGVPLTGVGTATWVVAVSLIAGKPLGVLLTTVAAGWLGFRRSEGLDLGSVLLTGIAAGIGFTVALFFTTAAFAPGPIQDEAKIGALLSFLAAPLALMIGRLRRET